MIAMTTKSSTSVNPFWCLTTRLDIIKPSNQKWKTKQTDWIPG